MNIERERERERERESRDEKKKEQKGREREMGYLFKLVVDSAVGGSRFKESGGR